jgi:eukaryotic-like serine/threonine-protein kinase
MLHVMSIEPSRLTAALADAYTIDRKLGEGGMAVVYLATDLKHNRNVALKVLRPELAAVVGAERFLAEIETTANLQHPHILPLFDSGEADGFLFYVMPYVEGETLRERIDREKQLPVEEAVGIAAAVGNALQAAHDEGVVHRDIKPGNILLSRGEPLVADFGIALAVGAASQSRLTETGLSVGTPYYMSPEQATGDQQMGPPSDVYSLAAMLYEMLTGDPPYMGSTAQAVLGRIIQGQPVSATEVRNAVPANVDAAIRKALEKLPADRFVDARGFVRALSDAAFRHGEPAEAAVAAAGPWKRLSFGLAASTAVLAGSLAWGWLQPEPSPPVARFAAPFEVGQTPTGFAHFLPDGSLIYSGPGDEAAMQLWVRQWSDLEATPVRGSDGAASLTVSPSGEEVAFAPAGGPLRIISVVGGQARATGQIAIGVWEWGADGYIYFTGVDSFGLRRISEDGGGGDPEAVTEVREGEGAHGMLDLLPGGNVGVFQVWYSVTGEGSEIWAVDLETGERRFLHAGNSPRYVSTGHLLFGTDEGVLMGAPFDVGRAELKGPAVPIGEGLSLEVATGVPFFALSEAGTLIYLSGDVNSSFSSWVEPVWVTRSGDATPVDPGWTINPPLNFFAMRLSPDGTRVAVTHRLEGNQDVWIKQLPDGPFDRLTFDDGIDRYPDWTPDGQYVTYGTAVDGAQFALMRIRADGAGSPELLVPPGRTAQGHWGPDGQWMVFRTGDAGGEGFRDVVMLRPGVDSVAIPVSASQDFREQDPVISPDGKWLAYTSDESGRLEVYVRPFPDVDSGKVRVSVAGGMSPTWAHGGGEIFFINEQSLVSAEFSTESGFSVTQRQTLFQVPSDIMIGERTDYYAVSPDDQRFMFARFSSGGSDEDDGGTRWILVQNFFEELKERVPGG